MKRLLIAAILSMAPIAASASPWFIALGATRTCVAATDWAAQHEPFWATPYQFRIATRGLTNYRGFKELHGDFGKVVTFTIGNDQIMYFSRKSICDGWGKFMDKKQNLNSLR